MLNLGEQTRGVLWEGEKDHPRAWGPVLQAASQPDTPTLSLPPSRLCSASSVAFRRAFLGLLAASRVGRHWGSGAKVPGFQSCPITKQLWKLSQVH